MAMREVYSITFRIDVDLSRVVIFLFSFVGLE